MRRIVLLRSLAYHRGKLKKGSQRYGQVTGEMGYFRHNRDKMDYAAYQAAGLIISSGAGGGGGQTIVGHRLKRSGMRWTEKGGSKFSTCAFTCSPSAGIHSGNGTYNIPTNRWPPWLRKFKVTPNFSKNQRRGIYRRTMPVFRFHLNI